MSKSPNKLKVGLDQYPFSLDQAVVCVRCSLRFIDEANRECIQNTGMCLNCDHVEGEEQEDRLREYTDSQNEDD